MFTAKNDCGFAISLSLAALFSLTLLFGCGETDTSGTTENETYDSLFPLEANIPLSEYPEGWVRLTDEDVAELMNLVLPPNWWTDEDISHELKIRYNHAQLLRQFGDIPQVRYIIEFKRNPGFNFPTEANRLQLEDIRKHVAKKDDDE